MNPGLTDRQHPTGTGWMAGYVLGGVAGLVSWLVAEDVLVGVLVFAMASTVLGAVFDQKVESRPMTPRERRLALVLAGSGLAVVLIYVFLFA